eukprot:m.28307 g.28307  ORF g.28307 m.28307 type:complete len:63 (+) comp30674_c0_seq2:1016-1204(+)
MLAHSKCHRDPQDIFNWLDAVAKFSKDDILDYMQLVREIKGTASVMDSSNQLLVCIRGYVAM